MKNLPDKIYLNLGDLTEEEYNELDFKDLAEVTWSEDDVQGKNIEYVRKDAFTKKAANYLNYMLYDRVEIEKPGKLLPSLLSKGEFIEDFKKYMEE